MEDEFGRKITYMKITVTEASNLQCGYSIKEGLEGRSGELLTCDQIVEICRAAVEAGIDKFRLIGGEPLLREDVPEMIRRIKQIYGVNYVGMTTNGILLRQFLPRLKDAGLDAVNIAIDSLDPEHYQEITGQDRLQEVLQSVYAALDAGLQVKLNVVLQEDYAQDLDAFLELARTKPVSVRFIDLLPMGRAQDLRMLGNTEILSRIRKAYPEVEEDPGLKGAGPAVYFRIPGFLGTIGFVSPNHHRFCEGCNRIRLTARGQLVPCVSVPERENLRPILGMPQSNFRIHMLNEAMKYAVAMKPRSHS